MSQILQQIQVVQQQISGLTLTNGTNGQQTQNTNRTAMTTHNTNATNTTSIHPRIGLPWKQYCWTCGCCGHWGGAYPKNKEGHQDDASFKNIMGCSSKDCIWHEWGVVQQT